jgi:hypothetical protein
MWTVTSDHESLPLCLTCTTQPLHTLATPYDPYLQDRAAIDGQVAFAGRGGRWFMCATMTYRARARSCRDDRLPTARRPAQ